MKFPIQITNIAWKKIIEISTKKNTSGFIFSAKSLAVDVFPDPDGPSIAITIYTFLFLSKSQVIYDIYLII